MSSDQEINKKIEELQFLESHLQGFFAQKQNVQVEINEIDNALEELGKSEDEVYKIVSGLMIKSTREKLENELKEKKRILEMRVNSMEKQEKLLERDAIDLKKDIDKAISSGKKKE